MLFQPSGDEETPLPSVGMGIGRRAQAQSQNNQLKRLKLLIGLIVLFVGTLIYRQVVIVSEIENGDNPGKDLPKRHSIGSAYHHEEQQDSENNGVEDDEEEGDKTDPVAAVITASKMKRLEEQLAQLKLENERLTSKLNMSTGDENLDNLVTNGADWMKRHRIYCMVPTIYEPHRYEKIAAVIRTWGKRCDVIKLFIDPPREPGQTYPKYYELPGYEKVEMVEVALKRVNDPMTKDKKYAKKSCDYRGQKIPCRHIWEKVWRSWVYIADNDLDTADWFFKIDDDSFIFPEFLKLYFERNRWDPSMPYYFGHVSYLAPKPFVNGAMVGLSHKALSLVAEKYKTMPNEYGPRQNFGRHRCVDRDGASQEVTESICLHQLGINATTMIDQYGLQLVSLFRLSDGLFLRKRKGTRSWYWYGKPLTQICCSETPVAFHWYKHPNDLLKIDNYLYNESSTYLEENLYSRPLMDKTLEDPNHEVAAVISRASKIPLYKYQAEIHYLFKVRENIRLIRSGLSSTAASSSALSIDSEKV